METATPNGEPSTRATPRFIRVGATVTRDPLSLLIFMIVAWCRESGESAHRRPLKVSEGSRRVIVSDDAPDSARTLQ